MLTKLKNLHKEYNDKNGIIPSDKEEMKELENEYYKEYIYMREKYIDKLNLMFKKIMNMADNLQQFSEIYFTPNKGDKIPLLGIGTFSAMLNVRRKDDETTNNFNNFHILIDDGSLINIWSLADLENSWNKMLMVENLNEAIKMNVLNFLDEKETLELILSVAGFELKK